MTTDPEVDRCPCCNSKIGPISAARLKEELGKMTTDPEEGRRQIEAMKPEPLKVGDWVRLKAGQQRMLVIELYDYGNVAECRWETTDVHRERFPVTSLVRVE